MNYRIIPSQGVEIKRLTQGKSPVEMSGKTMDAMEKKSWNPVPGIAKTIRSVLNLISAKPTPAPSPALPPSRPSARKP